MVIHAEEEGDADVIIVRKAIELGEHEDVVVIAYDTDILVLVVYHAQFSPVLHGNETPHYCHRYSAASTMCWCLQEPVLRACDDWM